MNWQPIATAPKERDTVLVNDTNPGNAEFAAAKWLDGVEWEGWIYVDDLLQDCFPLGPQPTHWFDIPPLQPET